MDHNEQHLQPLGICHRLFCFIMKSLAAQALKPVTLGSPGPQQQKKSSATDQREMDHQDPGSIYGAEDSESSTLIDIEDETSRLLVAEGGGWWYNHGRVILVESVDESKAKAKAPRKMVSINDQPEIINEANKRRKKYEAMERRHEGELRPLRSILKGGSNLSKM